jgi:hypothetical protein
MVMSIAVELHKTEDDIAHWPLNRIIEWAAFFRLRDKWTKEQSNRRTVMDDTKGTVVEHL